MADPAPAEPSPGVLTALPLWARHLVLLVLPAVVIAAGIVLRAVVDAGGVLTAVNWHTVTASAVSGVALWVLLLLTPAERRYGVGSTPQTRAAATDTRHWTQTPRA